MWQLVELNGDLPPRQVLAFIDRLWQVDVVLVRDLGEQSVKLTPLWFKYRARGYDLHSVPEPLLADKLAEVKREVDLLRVQRGVEMAVLLNPQI